MSSLPLGSQEPQPYHWRARIRTQARRRRRGDAAVGRRRSRARRNLRHARALPRPVPSSPPPCWSSPRPPGQPGSAATAGQRLHLDRDLHRHPGRRAPARRRPAPGRPDRRRQDAGDPGRQPLHRHDVADEDPAVEPLLRLLRGRAGSSSAATPSSWSACAAPAVSSGCLDILGPGEQTDVVTAVEWAASQPWSTGKVGMYGKSYDANTGIVGAALQPEGLAAVVAQQVAPDRYRGSYNDRVRLLQSLAYPTATYGVRRRGQASRRRTTPSTSPTRVTHSADCQAAARRALPRRRDERLLAQPRLRRAGARAAPSRRS